MSSVIPPREAAILTALTDLEDAMRRGAVRQVLGDLYDKGLQSGVDIEAAEQVVDQVQGTQTRLRKVRPV